MKNVLLALSLFLIAGYSKLNAQVVNNSFENWYLDTFRLPPNEISTLPGDTISFYDPVGWTSSNSLTKLDSIGGKIFVTQSSQAFSGNSAVQMITDTIGIPIIAHAPVTRVIIPGFVVNGIFPITSVKLNGTVSVISPISIPGAGQPFNQRLATINGFYNYAPAYNNLAHSNDTCVIWATLRKGTTPVANAIFKSTDSTAGYQAFSADFHYVSCDMPDTLVILIASSVPNVSNFLGAGNGMVAGSKLLVDSITYTALSEAYTFAPFAQNDLFTVYKNSVDTLNVLANDTDCSGAAMAVAFVNGPHHGTATILPDYSIRYTPDNNYSGLDTIIYRDTNVNSDTSDAICTIYVTNSNGINEINTVTVNLFPVPADNMLNIQFQNPGKCTGRIYDVVGNAVLSTELNSNHNQISIQNLTNGIYAIELLNNENTVIGRSKFVVTR